MSDPRTASAEIFDENLFVTAGAGSGKTTLLVQRYLNAITKHRISPERILAITFTDKAANEMKERLVTECLKRGLVEERRLLENAPICTIHSFCSRLLKENPIESGVDPSFRIFGEGEAELLMDRVMDALFEEEAENTLFIQMLRTYKESGIRQALRYFYELVRVFDDEELLFRFEGSSREKEEFRRIFQRFKTSYEAQKKARSAYDFEDLMVLAYRLLSGPGGVQKEVRKRIQGQFLTILVDETQDTSFLQFRILDHLRSQKNLFVVGDIQQSIYGFRHAEPELFQEFVGKIPHAKKIHLEENFRSHKDIIEFVNQFFSKLSPKTFRPLVAAKPHEAKKTPSIECLPFYRAEEEDLEESRVKEAKYLAAHIQGLVKRGEFRCRDIAILFRASSNVYLYEKELSDRGILYTFSRGEGFYEKREIKDIVNFLRLIENPDQDIPLAGVLRSPLVGVSDDGLFWLSRAAKKNDKEAPLAEGLSQIDRIQELSAKDREKLEKFVELWKECRRDKNRVRLSELFWKILRRTDAVSKLLADSEGKQRLANVLKLAQITESLESRGMMGAQDFVDFLNGLAERQVFEAEARRDMEQEDRVTLSTIHGAKGLEFPCVVLADMGAGVKRNNQGFFLAHPDIGFGIKPDETYGRIQNHWKEKNQKEELRLLYVAMTRAKERLIFSGVMRESSWMGLLARTVGVSPGGGNVRFGEVEIHVREIR